MNPPDTDLMGFVKDFLWAPLLGLVAWAWHRNEKEHDDMRSESEKIRNSMYLSSSSTQDRMMEYIDKQVTETKQFVIQEDTKLIAELGIQRNHIGKLFDKLEEHGRRSEDRHLETLAAIHAVSNAMHQGLAGKADK